VTIEDSTDFFRRMIEVAREFDFAVADGGDFCDGAFEFLFERKAHGVKLQTDGIDLAGRNREPDGPDRKKGGCNRRLHKSAAVHRA
jgi:hypothetical protein